MNKETIKWSPYYLPFSGNRTTFCVLVYVVDNVYELHLFDGFIKRFTNSTLPKELSKNLTMIKAVNFPILKDEEGLTELECYHWKKITKDNKEFLWIGWRVSPHVFVLTLEMDEIYKLQGLV